jgi:hypothetical protein
MRLNRPSKASPPFDHPCLRLVLTTSLQSLDDVIIFGATHMTIDENTVLRLRICGHAASGALLPDGVIQSVVLFAAGLAVKTEGLWLVGLCLLAWLASLLFYGWQWDRRRHF